MSSVVISGNTSGTVTLDAPAIAGSTTITLPSTSGTMALTSQLGGITFLGTITTTSGSSAELSGLTLTDYKFLMMGFQGVSLSGAGDILLGNSTSDDVVIENLASASSTMAALGFLDLENGWFYISNSGVDTAISNASTTITLAASAGTFDAGSVRVYGVK